MPAIVQAGLRFSLTASEPPNPRSSICHSSQASSQSRNHRQQITKCKDPQATESREESEQGLEGTCSQYGSSGGAEAESSARALDTSVNERGFLMQMLRCARPPRNHALNRYKRQHRAGDVEILTIPKLKTLLNIPDTELKRPTKDHV